VPYHLYSVESFPSDTLLGKPMYTPEYLAHWGITLQDVKGGQWMEFKDNFYNTYHADWKDRAGTRRHIAGEDLFKALKQRFANRGVAIFDHAPTAAEKAIAEKDCMEKNLAFRMASVEAYENEVNEKKVTGHGRTKPTPYEDECYTLLGLTKPYSVEAMRAQRHPGEAVGEQIVAALVGRLEKRRASEAAPAQSPK
jgi:hypothetical protein